MKKGLFNLAFLLAFGLLLYYGSVYQEYLHSLTATTYNGFPALVFRVVFPVSLGLLLTLPYILENLTTKGQLVVDRVRILLLGIPTGYATIMPFIAFSPMAKYLVFSHFILDYSIVHFFSGVAFSYITVTSLKKLS